MPAIELGNNQSQAIGLGQLTVADGVGAHRDTAGWRRSGMAPQPGRRRSGTATQRDGDAAGRRRWVAGGVRGTPGRPRARGGWRIASGGTCARRVGSTRHPILRLNAILFKRKLVL
ncbi:hypothetical protein FMUAM8_38440 [Nocardia cyriacigeorgica]|nr:hypothetical protein FMUAM8_38440 [Nocardia cyriacigeorgica]